MFRGNINLRGLSKYVVEWIRLSRDRGWWFILVNMVIKIWVGFIDELSERQLLKVDCASCSWLLTFPPSPSCLATAVMAESAYRIPPFLLFLCLQENDIMFVLVYYAFNAVEF